MSRNKSNNTKKWVREAQRKMGLAHWVIDVRFSRRLDCRAETAVLENSQHAIITFGPHHLADDERMQKWTVAHELMHVHTARLCESFSSAVAEKHLLEQVDQREEQMVDALGKCWAEVIWPS